MVGHNRRTVRVKFVPVSRRRALPNSKSNFDPKTHEPIGITSKSGIETEIVIYERLVVDRKIDDEAFQFSPANDWKRVTGKSVARC